MSVRRLGQPRHSNTPFGAPGLFTCKLRAAVFAAAYLLATMGAQEDSHMFPRPIIHAGIDSRGPRDLKEKF